MKDPTASFSDSIFQLTGRVALILWFIAGVLCAAEKKKELTPSPPPGERVGRSDSGREGRVRGRHSIFSHLQGLGVRPLVTSQEFKPSELRNSASVTSEYLGSAQCAQCHSDIASTQFLSDHARSVRKVDDISELVSVLPLAFADATNDVQYRLERSSRTEFPFDLVASKADRTERLNLLWAFGAGRKGITFVGRSETGKYGQSRLSWYSEIKGLDITPGSKEEAKDAHEALADWFEGKKREECFGCHISRQAELLPEIVQKSSLGIQCERCHGPGQKHFEAVTQGRKELAIRHPGKLSSEQQFQFCGQCHRQPPGDFEADAISKIIADKRTVRVPAQRLILSRCYIESDGKLKCTTCHNPHHTLTESVEYFDRRCLSCHTSGGSQGTQCPVSRKDCVSCHMQRERLAKHLVFADHWIRRAKGPRR